MKHNQILSKFVDLDNIDYNKINKKILCYQNIKIVYNFIEKNGCSNLKMTFAKANGAEHLPDIHQASKDYFISAYNPEFNINSAKTEKEKRLIYQFFLQSIKQEKYKTILVLRNPYKRIVSGYLNKITNFETPFVYNIIKDIFIKQRRINEALVDQLIKEGHAPTFYEFLIYIVSLPDAKTENHFCQQASMIYLNEFSEIFNLDDLDKKWSTSTFYEIPLVECKDQKQHSTSRNKIISSTEYEYFSRDLIHMEGQDLLAEIQKHNVFPSYKLFFLDRRIRDLFNERFQTDIELFNSLFHIDAQQYIDLSVHSDSTFSHSESDMDRKIHVLQKTNYDLLRTVKSQIQKIGKAIDENANNLRPLQSTIDQSLQKIELKEVANTQNSLSTAITYAHTNLASKTIKTQKELAKQIATLSAQIVNTQETLSAQIQDLHTSQINYIENQYDKILYTLNCLQIKKSFCQSLKNYIFQTIIKKKAFGLCNNGKLEESEAIVLNVIRNNPYMSWAYYVLGKSQWGKEKYELAIDNIQKAIDLDPHIEYYKIYKKSIMRDYKKQISKAN